MRTAPFVAPLWLALSLFGCSSSSSSSNKSSHPIDRCASASDQSSNEACLSCVSSKCNSQASTCYGSDYANGNYSGGPCSDILNCSVACACNDANCLLACANKTTTACGSCSQTYDDCESANCKVECNSQQGNGSTDGGLTFNPDGGLTFSPDGSLALPSSGATCADLKTCCSASSFPSSVATECKTAADQADESNCDFLYTEFASIGYCTKK